MNNLPAYIKFTLNVSKAKNKYYDLNCRISWPPSLAQADRISFRSITAVLTEICMQWNLDLSFFKGMEKQNAECGKTINPGNYYHCK